VQVPPRPSDPDTGPIRSIAIVGGGTAGWISAAILARALTNTGTRITLIESAHIGIIGVGEATIPPFVDMLRFRDINLADFIRRTEATMKLAIRFDGWNGPDSSYWHPFGTFGTGIARRPFHHSLLYARAGTDQPGVTDFNLCAALAARDLAFSPEAPPPGGARFALHLDATLVAGYLRNYAETLGVIRIEATVAGAHRDERGLIAAVALADGRRVAADLFIDASGFSGVLIERELGTGYIDWRAHLPCDRALAMPTARETTLPPYTVAHAMDAGWRWRIPLQHRSGNGYVYSSAHLSDDRAAAELQAALGNPQSMQPRQLRFVPGRRTQAWVGNCVAIGLASGFLEPLESTSIHLVTAGVFNLLDHFPDRSFSPALAASYNTELAQELEQIRDFLILHYCLTTRRDTPFWADLAAAPLPDSLRDRIALYADAGIIRPAPRELFTDASWFYVLDGMGLTPRRSDPLIAAIDPAVLRTMLSRISHEAMAAGAHSLPHDVLFPPHAAARLSATRIAQPLHTSG
jgi:tryptophan halogenase